MPFATNRCHVSSRRAHQFIKVIKKARLNLKNLKTVLIIPKRFVHDCFFEKKHGASLEFVIRRQEYFIMSKTITIESGAISAPKKGVFVVLLDHKGHVAFEAEKIVGKALIERIVSVRKFEGKKCDYVDEVCDGQKGFDRLIVLGIGDSSKLDKDDWLKLGGAARGAIGEAQQANICLKIAGEKLQEDNIVDFVAGLRLRDYKFDRYKTAQSQSETKTKSPKITILLENSDAGKALIERSSNLSDAVILARNLVNEPANILGTDELVEQVKKLTELGVKVDIIEEKEMKKFGMGALLGVARGSKRPPYLAVMQWQGGKSKESPLAFVGKGVVFDSGGISLKPGAGMEDMKGDMGGAAAVVGLMKSLSLRKAKVNVVGVIGIVENMPDGNAQRPGDVVTSMSGQTIEVINTDAEGRLVLADALWYTKENFAPKIMINLATLTGAIMVALGSDHAGLFSNDDTLAEQLFETGQKTGEKVWRMPLNDTYDKIVDSKVADMRNSCGRLAGSITAAQFLKRFVGNVSWAHLDIAGTAMNSPENEYNRSWGAGFGVRLLDRLVRDYYEA